MPMRKTTKTWATLSKELAGHFATWKKVYTLDAQLVGRSASKSKQTLAERTVICRFSLYGKPITVKSTRADRAVDNLAIVVRIVETLRMSQYYGIEHTIRDIYRDVWPSSAAQWKEPEPRVIVKDVPEHYRIAGLHPDAPPELVKAARKALAFKYHPDRGGDEAILKNINQALDKIEAEKGM